MNRHKTEILISILMESPQYLTMPIEARHSLLSRLLNSYPSLFDACDGCDKCDKEETHLGYESSWKGLF